jgi:hypothetical protein
MTDYPGSEVQPPAQPAVQPPVEPEKKSGAKKWLSVAGTVAVVGIGAAYSLTGGFGIGDPEVGDCVQMTSDTDFDVVDCGAAEAEYKIVGIDEDEMTYPDFEDAVAADTACAEFRTWEVALWIGDLETEPGTIYCSAPA